MLEQSFRKVQGPQLKQSLTMVSMGRFEAFIVCIALQSAPGQIFNTRR